MNHFPIFKHQFSFQMEDVITYISLFEDHRYESFLINRFQLLSKHIYPDGLTIHIIWNIKAPISLSPTLSFSDLFLLKNASMISPHSFMFLSFSKQEHLISDQVLTVFKRFFSKFFHFTQEDYIRLEFEVKEKSSISDLFYHDLIRTIKLYLDFEAFLKKKKN